MKPVALKSKRITIFRNFIISAFLMIAAATVVIAQSQISASISGRVEDSSGAAVPGTTVYVTNVETGAARTISSDEAGNFRALSLPIGRYALKAEKPGFKAVVKSGISLAVGQDALVNLTLEVGQVQEQVTVTAEAPLVNTTTAAVASLVGERQVKDLPLNGRSFDNLITLNAGAVNYTSMKIGAAAGAAAGSYFSVAGRRPMENLFLLNGVEYTGASEVGVTPGGVSGQLLGIDAVREFNVVSSTYSAEYGKRAGAQVSVVTQSGTNTLHGTVFEFLRNSALDARNFFDQLRVPAFQRNQFGGSAGGPVRKDKTFLFGNYEGFRQRLGISDVTFVPDVNARRGLLPDAQGVPTPVQGLNPAMLPYFAFWPLPNGPNLGGGIAIAYSNPKQSIREDFGTTRFDQNISSKDSFSAIYTIDDGYNLLPMANPLFAGINTLRAQVASVQETRVFSPNVLNTFTAGFSRGGFLFISPPINPSGFPSNLAFVTGALPGSVVIGAGSATSASAITPAGAANAPNVPVRRNLFTYTDSVQVIRGRHQISAGVWFERIRSNESIVSRTWGQANFSTLQSFLQGTVAQFIVAPNTIPMGWRSLEGAWYVKDSIQVRRNLTLQLGLRHEFTNGWNEATGRAASFLFDSNGVPLTTPRIGSSVLTENNSKWLFGPRIGLAWDPFGKGKTSIRAGFGTYYNMIDSTAYVMDSVPPFNGPASYSNVPLLSLLPIARGTPLPPACGPGVPNPCTTYSPYGLQSSAKAPTVESWNFTIEQQLSPAMALRLTYLGSRGYHEIIALDPNVVRPQVCANASGCTSGGVGSARATVPQGTEYLPVANRPNANLASGTFWFTEGSSSYHGLQIELTRRLAAGLQFKGNYTWAKSLDVGSGILASQSINEPGTVLDLTNLRRDWGPAAHSITHQGSGNFSYDLPFGNGKPWLNGFTGITDKLVSGWELNGIVTLLSGFPFTPQVGSNQSGNGDRGSPDRPSVNPAFTGSVILGSPKRWFNPIAYLLPTPGTFGNLGRGVLRGPGMTELDFSLFKNTKLSERFGLQFRSEVFNIINHANFGLPSPVVFTGGTYSPSAGVISGTATTSRQIQFGLKLIF